MATYELSIIQKWHECGTVTQGANGLISLDWPQIESWASLFYTEEYVEWVEHPRPDKRYKLYYSPILLKQCTLLDCELQMIRKLSQEYAGEYALASDSARPCPKYIDIEDVSEEVAAANATAMKEAFNMFKK